MVKVLHDAVSVVLADYVDDLAREAQGVGNLNAFFYVASDNRNRKVGIYLVVLVLSALVFDKIFALVDFSNVVVIRAYPRHQGIGSDGLAGVLRQLRDHKRMVVSSAGGQKHFAHHRIVQVAKVYQAEDGRGVQYLLKRRDKAKDQNAAKEAVDGKAKGDYSGAVKVVVKNHFQQKGRQNIQHGGYQGGEDHLYAVFQLADYPAADKARGKRVKENDQAEI